MRNAPEVDLGEVALDEPSRPIRARIPRWALVAAAVAAAVLAVVITADGTSHEDDPPDRPDEAVVQARARVVVFPHRGLDDVLLLGAPFGVEDRGSLVTIDLATGSVTARVHDGSLWPPGIDEPTTDAAYPDAEAAATSPDGEHVAVFTRSATSRETGVSLYVTGSFARRFVHLQSVEAVVGGRLAWSADSEAVYLIAASADGSADRVIGIPVTGSAQTVVRLDERGYVWLAAD